MPLFFFQGDPLKPFSFGRQMALQRIASMGSLSALESSTLLVYLCTLEREEIERTRTQDGLARFHEKMEAWPSGSVRCSSGRTSSVRCSRSCAWRGA